jgi:hypothetical protein
MARFAWRYFDGSREVLISHVFELARTGADGFQPQHIVLQVTDALDRSKRGVPVASWTNLAVAGSKLEALD